MATTRAHPCLQPLRRTRWSSYRWPPHKPGVLEKAEELRARLSKFVRVKLDDSENSPGWKFAQWEMKGVPLRLEIGPQDIENGQCVLVRRDNREKAFTKLEDLRPPSPLCVGRAGQKPVRPRRGKPRRAHPGRPRPWTRWRARRRRERLHQDHVVRRSGLRGNDEGKGGAFQPVHAFRAGASFRRMPLLRQAREGHGGVGQGVLRNAAQPPDKQQKQRRPRGAALCIPFYLFCTSPA